MFEKLKAAVHSLSTAVSQRTLSQKEVEAILWNFELTLLESDVAQEVASRLLSDLRGRLVGEKIRRSRNSAEYVGAQVVAAVKAVFSDVPSLDVFGAITSGKRAGKPFVIVYLGVNGTGKTTTIAKFAHLLKRRGFSVILACADTHRAGAIEQLTEHASRLGLKIVSQKYGADPAAVGRDAVLYAQSHRADVVLIDTAGRMQTSRNLMEEMAKVIRVVEPDLKIFVGDSLAGNDAISQAKEFAAYTNFDAVILTKADADVKGGAALSIAYVTKKPIVFLGTGQSYDDLLPFSVDDFVGTVFGKSPGITIGPADAN